METTYAHRAAAPGSRSAPFIIVAVDGSASSAPVLAWAAREAIARDADLRAVDSLVGRSRPNGEHVGGTQPTNMIALLDDVRRRHPSVRLGDDETHLARHGSLIAESRGAELLVIGASTARNGNTWLPGAPSSVAPRRSSCPVVVVRGRGHEKIGRVVVGFDGSRASTAALDWAVDEADLWSTDILLVRAWTRADEEHRSMRSVDLHRAHETCALDLAVRRCRQRGGQAVSGVLCEGDAAAVLFDSTSRCDLLVVGSRRSGFKTMMFGAVATSIMNDATCSAVVVHPTTQAV